MRDKSLIVREKLVSAPSFTDHSQLPKTIGVCKHSQANVRMLANADRLRELVNA